MRIELIQHASQCAIFMCRLHTPQYSSHMGYSMGVNIVQCIFQKCFEKNSALCVAALKPHDKIIMSDDGMGH